MKLLFWHPVVGLLGDSDRYPLSVRLESLRGPQLLSLPAFSATPRFHRFVLRDCVYFLLFSLRLLSVPQAGVTSVICSFLRGEEEEVVGVDG